MGYEPGWPQHITWAHPSGDTGQSHRCDGHLQKVFPPGAQGWFCASSSGNLADRKQTNASLDVCTNPEAEPVPVKA